MSFKNHSDVVSNIKYDEQFKFTDTAATLVGNRQFLQGYYDSVNNIDNAAAHIWNAISAVADDIGNTIYTNIQNYAGGLVVVLKIKLQKIVLVVL